MWAINLKFNCVPFYSWRRMPGGIWEYGRVQSRISGGPGLHVRHWTYGKMFDLTISNIRFLILSVLCMFACSLTVPPRRWTTKTTRTEPLPTWSIRLSVKSCPISRYVQTFIATIIHRYVNILIDIVRESTSLFCPKNSLQTR